MQVKVPYIFEGGISYSRNRRDDLSAYHWRDVHFETTEIDIPELTDSDARVAAAARVLANGDWRDVSFRHYNGRFYAPSNVDGARAATAEMLAVGGWPSGGSDEHPVYQAYASYAKSHKLFGWSEGAQIIKGMLAGHEYAVPRAIVQWDRREECRAAAFDALSSLILVDNRLWHEVHEPKLVVEVSTEQWPGPAVTVSINTDACMGVPAFLTNDRNGLSVQPENFRAFQMADLEEALEFGSRFECIGPLQIRVSDIVVSMPETLSAETGVIHLAKAASDFLVQTSGTLFSASDEDMMAWMALRGQLYDAQCGNGDEQALLGGIVRMTQGDWLNAAVRNALKAIEVYDEMPVAIGAAPGPVLRLL